MSKAFSSTSTLPFSPDKGKPVPVDPAFEFEAPRFCDLEDENYDFFEDYEKYAINNKYLLTIF